MKAVEISLTSFVDFVLKSGTPKLTVVKNAKKMKSEDYKPYRDYYKKLREGIIDFHRNQKPEAFLDSLSKGISDKNKKNHYPIIINGYKQFYKKKKGSVWFTPPKLHWENNNLEVLVNPELGLIINKEQFLIKLYFKSDKPRKNEVPTILQLMQSEAEKEAEKYVCSFLDVRRGRMYKYKDEYKTCQSLLEGEALSFEKIYNQIVI